MNPYKIFKTEIDELEAFYKTSSFAIDRIYEIYRHEKKLIGTELYLKLLPLEKPIFFKKNKRFMVNQQYFLRELILIRLISALEVYLIDNIKYIAANNIVIFKTNDTLSFSTSKLISYDSITEIHEEIITKDCRRLSSGGFNEITAYYNTKFKLNIASITPGKKIMEEYHDRRHLFVHRLGKTDEYYRHKYSIKRAGLSIGDSYLLKAFEDVKKYADTINNSTTTLIENKPNTNSLKSEKLIVFNFNYKNELPDFLNSEYRFWHNDKLVSTKDILKSFTKLENNIIKVVLFGPSLKVAAFYKNAKNRVTSKSDISNIQTMQEIDYGAIPPIEKNIQPKSEKNMQPQKVQCVDENIIEQVKCLLPEQPWHKGVHLEVAEKLELSKKEVRNAITILIKRGVFKNQIDGLIIE